ncbi:MAG: serine protein kinase RIO [Candidatus Nitrosopumilus limneticus]|nr:Non-specific serine/threonine protein kinase [Candidatus Nitrosopumilus limneticus]MDA0669229.1 serine protein kinase RIO [Thermoproteota archaeon]HJJ21485.1 serine protein kinase RIO [Nitrosopumilus sp.]MDA0853217.1 serine protein kinase RIO [Thermoproteota archaeon]MDA1123727.1 serine protein kinase RIO [Thermoproteota archaeon]
MTDTISRKLESKIDNKLISKSRRHELDDGFKKGKVINEVLDKPTVMTLYKMITDHVIAYVNGSVSAGKESLVFWGVTEDNSNVALKIYLVSTSNFKKREPYIVGDPRFRHVKKGTKNLVYLWAKKEHRNLNQCYKAGIPVPRPLYVTNNVLVMDFVGVGGSPCKSLLTSNVEQNDYEQAISLIRDLYNKAKLVHGDFSEYNIFKTDDGLVVFDMGSAVDLRHPNSKEFLKRDINNITRFFEKRGMIVEDPVDIFEDVVNEL